MMKKWTIAVFAALLWGWVLAGATVTVQKGDSLGAIAARYNTSVSVLQRLNNLTGINIRVGQVLQLPSSSRVTVQAGDSLQSIAARHGVSVEALRSVNGITGDRIRVGQEFKLPSTSTRQPATSTNNTKTVEVESGDTLGGIAKRHNTTIEALQRLNGFSGNNIRIGQVLKVPATVVVSAKPPTTDTVVVKAGDSLEKIAKRHNISVATLRAANNLTSDAIRVGATLRLSVAKPTTSQKPQPSKPNPNKPTSTSQKPNSKPSQTKPTTTPSASSLPKPSGKPTTNSTSKPSTSSASKPSKPASNNSAKPNAAVKPSSSGTVKPSSSGTVKPSSNTTRVINPPPNLPTASGRVVTIAPNVATRPPAPPMPKPTAVPTSGNAKPTTPPVATASKPLVTAATKPPASNAANASSQSAPKPTTVNPPVAMRAPEPAPSSTSTSRPSGMPSTLGFAEPLEAPQASPVIDPSLESPYLDATAPSSTPTAPSDLIDDIDIEIPDNQSAANIKPPPNIGDTPSYSRSEKVLWPLSGTLTSRFGWRRLRGNRFHTGIDLAAPTGTRVYAALSGRIEFAGWNRQGYGYLVIVRGWDNRQYYYGHNSRLLVKRGQWVRQGQIISRVGSTGFSTGPHLHFEIRVAGKAKNPLAYLPSSRLAQASAVR
jgi:murein DD-endopeptidase MepM/ murein hydrolase activator NlpD